MMLLLRISKCFIDANSMHRKVALMTIFQMEKLSHRGLYAPDLHKAVWRRTN